MSLSRRDLFRLAAVGGAAAGSSSWLARLAHAAAPAPARKRACILLWMNGGPSQMDTFDCKPGHKNGGPVKEIATASPGIRVTEHLPQVAKHMKRMSVVRSVVPKEADHSRATYLMHTGRAPGGPIQYPTLGSLVSKELNAETAALPGFVSIGTSRFLSPGAHSSGFLGPKHAPLIVGDGDGAFANPMGDAAAALRVRDLAAPAGVTTGRADARLDILGGLDDDFQSDRGSALATSHRTAYARAVALMRSEAVKAFDLDKEPKSLRDRYGNNAFGQGCLLARRLVAQGVPFVEVSLNNAPGVGGWDTHQDNFNAVAKLCGVLDPAWATLMSDLADHGLLDTTTVVWMGDFGRTPKINGSTGRDHWGVSSVAVLGGGGIKGGVAHGKTTADGMEVADNPVSVPDLIATVGTALGLDPEKQNDSNVGRPIRFVDPGAKAVKEILA